MNLLLLACAGGAIGAGARHLVSVGTAQLLGVTTAAAFPWATLIVNVAGSFLMGVLVEALALRFGGSPELRTFLATGVLGGFTTFSAFSLDFATLMSRKQEVLAGVYVMASVGLSLAAIYLGFLVARQMLS